MAVKKKPSVTPVNQTKPSHNDPAWPKYDLPPSGNNRQFDSGAQRDNADTKLRMSLVPSVELARVTRHYLNGGIKYGFNNWKKGMPLSVYFDSANRHIQAWWLGDTSEDHLAAAVWNILGAMWTETNLPDQDDRKDFK